MNEAAENIEENPVDFICPYCGKQVSFPNHEAGSPQECPYCAQIFVVPRAAGEAGGVLPLPVVTARLSLERLQPGDLEGLLEFMADEELLRDFVIGPMDEATLVEWLDEDPARLFTRPGQSLWLGVHLSGEQKPIGLAWLAYATGETWTHQFQPMRIDVIIGRQHQRQGYGTEAVRGLLEFGFRGIHVRRIIVARDPKNLAGGRTLEKAGLRQEGEFLKDRLRNGQWVDTTWYALLAEEFQSP